MQSFSAFNIRLPVDLKTWVLAKAEENGRSLNREIIQMIKAERDRSEQKERA